MNKFFKKSVSLLYSGEVRW